MNLTVSVPWSVVSAADELWLLMMCTGDSTEQRGAGPEDSSDIPDAVRCRRGPAHASAVSHRRQRPLYSELIHLLQQDGDRHHDTGTLSVKVILVRCHRLL